MNLNTLPPDFKIYTAAESADLPWLLKALHDAGLVPHYTMATLLRATEHSLCFSACVGTRQIGFARVVTDRATVSMINDVVVDPEWRGRGVGTVLMAAVLNHPSVSRTICTLQTKSAAGFYQKFGFVPVGASLNRDPQ